MENLGAIAKQDGLFVHALRSQRVGKLAIGADCFVVVFQQLALFLRRPCRYLPLPPVSLVFISQDFYLLPIHHGEIDAPPVNICQQSRTRLLSAQDNPFQVGCAIEKGIAQVSPCKCASGR